MATTNTIAKVFETVLSIPGMNDNVKIQSFAAKQSNWTWISRWRNLSDGKILGIAPKDPLKELKSISDDLLKKPGLIEMNEKQKMFWNKNKEVNKEGFDQKKVNILYLTYTVL